MKRKLLCSIFACAVFLLKAQTMGQVWSCHTSTSQSLHTNYSSTDNMVVNEDVKVVNVFFHILRMNDGSGGLTAPQVEDFIQILHDDYRNYNILFREIGRANLNNSNYFNGITGGNYLNMINTNRQPNAINIYLLSPTDGYSRAENIPSLAYCVGGIYHGSSVISHEMGHCLGLYHTHSGSGCNDTVNCRESINRSDCNSCGDLICDTPADPCLSGKVNNRCEYTGGNGYSPDVQNIMSYVPPSCLTRFSDGQQRRIHHTITNSGIFNGVYYIQPPHLRSHHPLRPSHLHHRESAAGGNRAVERKQQQFGFGIATRK